MPMPSLPSTVNPAKWNTLAKGIDSAKIGPTIEKVAKGHLSVARLSVLDAAKFPSVDEAEKALKGLAAAEKEVASLSADAKLLAKLAKENAKEIGKQKAEAGKLLDGLVGDASDYAKKLEAAVATARTAIEAAIGELKKKAKEDEAEEGEGEDDGKLDKLLARVQGVLLRDLVKYEPKPGQPSAYRFMFAWAKVQGKMDTVLLAGKTKFGAPHLAMLREQWDKAFAPSNTTSGDLSFDRATLTWVFSCRGKLPPKTLLLSQLKRTKDEGGAGKALKIKLQKLVKGKNGEEKFEDATEADENVAAQESGATEGGDVKVDASAAARAHRDALKSRVEAALQAGGAAAGKLRQAWENVDKSLAANAEAANGWLRAVEQLLDSAASTAGGAAATQFAQARTQWLNLHKRFHDGVDDLIKLLDEIYREEPEQKKEVDRAKAELKAAAGKVGREVEAAMVMLIQAKDKAAADAARPKARALIEATRNTLASDKLLSAIDGNELKSDMIVVQPMRELLDRLSKSLG